MDQVAPVEILERVGINNFDINYIAKRVYIGKEDMRKLLSGWDGDFVPVTVLRGGFAYTTEVDVNHGIPRHKPWS